MKVTEEQKGNITLFALEGRLDSHTADEVEKKIVAAIDGKANYVILDFSAIEYISSAGIRALVHCHKRLEAKQGEIILVSVPKHIENVLYITGFLPYFQILDTKAHAIEKIGKKD